MLKTLNNFAVLNVLNEKIKKTISVLYIFNNYDYVRDRHVGENGFNIIFITNDHKTFAFGKNSCGQLGLGHNNVVIEPQIIVELCGKKIINFVNGCLHTIAITESGEIYCWGFNNYGVLGLGPNMPQFEKPKLNDYLSHEKVISVICGGGHTVVLTQLNFVYSWGYNNWGQVGNNCKDDTISPTKLNFFDTKRIKMISCGFNHSLALTENGQVFSWGRNLVGQLGIGDTVDSIIPQLVIVVNENKNNVFIEKVSCGQQYSLLLSSDGDIYVFGKSTIESEIYLHPRKITNQNKFLDISSHFWLNDSILLSDAGLHYAFISIGLELFELKNYESFYDIFAKYFQITIETKFSDTIIQHTFENDFFEHIIISCGSFGVVTKVSNKINGCEYAIKKIALNVNEIELVSRELEIMRRLQSRYVVEYTTSWIEDNYYIKEDFRNRSSEIIHYGHRVFDKEKTFLLHIQMELCISTLEALMFQIKNELNPKNSQKISSIQYYIEIELFKEILECVEFLHKRNIIHRDLKPENILITDGRNGRFIKIGDFGLSVKHEFINQSHTEDRGTVKYMAPEVIRSRKYNMKADVYSLGLISQHLFSFQM
jgi:hypothetical protein